MNKHTCLLRVVRRGLALGALLAVGAPGARAQTALPAATVARIDSVFALFSVPASPGCAVSVVREGAVIFAKGYGMSDLQHDVPITPSSIFHVASISKQFTTFSIALLASEGKLDLDDDIRKYLPEVHDFGTTITIRHLIHHTSGLRDQWSLLGLSGWRPDDPKTEDDILWLVSRQRALNFTPGSEHLYSNTGYTLLGTIVERVSGKSLRQFTTERIFGPLGMTNTHFHDDHTMIVPGRTSAYARRADATVNAGAERYAISIPVFDNAGATSLFTTVQDMARWDANFVQPKVGDARVMQVMHERGKLADGTELAYAGALVHGEMRGLKTVGHGGADAGYRAHFVRFPEQRHAFVTLCNVSNANPAQLSAQVAAILLEDKMSAGAVGSAAAPAESPREIAMDVAELRQRAGLYLDRRSWNTAEVVFNDNTKSLHGGRAANARRLVHVGDNEFVLTGTPQRFRLIDNTMTAIGADLLADRIEPAQVTPEALRALAGRYRSEELDVDWIVSVVGDSALMLSRRRAPDQRLVPTFLDGFRAPVGNIRFTRDSAGTVNGFQLTAGRVRAMEFERVRQSTR